jgi:hypothetical protein
VPRFILQEGVVLSFHGALPIWITECFCNSMRFRNYSSQITIPYSPVSIRFGLAYPMLKMCHWALLNRSCGCWRRRSSRCRKYRAGPADRQRMIRWRSCPPGNGGGATVGAVLGTGGHVEDDDNSPDYVVGEAPGGGPGLVVADAGAADACGAGAETDSAEPEADPPPVVVGRSAAGSVLVPTPPKPLGSIKSR